MDVDGWVEVVRSSPAWLALALVAAAAMAEYLVPPLPADTILLGGAWVVVSGVASFAAVLTAAVVGGAAGATAQWLLGRGLRKDDGRLRLGKLARVIPEEEIVGFMDYLRRWGPWILLINRAMPAVRGGAFVAVGAAGLPLGRALVFGMISQVVWAGAILGLGVWIGDNWDDLVRAYAEARTWVFGFGGAVLVGWVCIRLWRRKKTS